MCPFPDAAAAKTTNLRILNRTKFLYRSHRSQVRYELTKIRALRSSFFFWKV